MATVATRWLTEEQVRSYRRDGYVAVSHVIDATRLAELRAVTDEFVERSRAVTKSDALFDLDPRHTAARPVLRRIKNLGSENGLSCPRHTAWCPPRCRVITVGRRVITVGGV